ncbi:cobalamin B12-binding domain-containing protein [Streptomyces sp. NPDC048111]|uniref:cobalamin B12-binding domain-containing protein n=1 Tax=Streptomyces sp. NPDC048111 TaxID=3365500 RepID=UPI003724BFDB
MTLTAAAPEGLDIVVSTMASDAHTWNLVFLQLLLEELGHRVTNLGACVPDDLIVDHCRRARPDLIVLSSVNGHGRLDGQRVIDRLRAVPELAATPTVIGGKLGISDEADAQAGRALREAGFDEVFTGMGAIERFRAYLAERTSAVAA